MSFIWTLPICKLTCNHMSEPTWAWTRLIGSAEYDYGISIATGSDGSIYVAGTTRGNLDGQTSNGNFDAFVTKYSADGDRAWTRLVGSAGFDYTESITTGSDGSIYVAGSTDSNLDGQANNGVSDAFVAKYSADGDKVWTRLIGSANAEYAGSIIGGSDGSIYVAGSTEGNLDGQSSNGNSDAFITKYSADGDKVWTRLIGSVEFDDARSITIGSDGSIYVAGSSGGNLDGQTGNGNSDAFVAKYSADGDRVWTRLIGSTEYDYAESIATGSDGSVYVAGTSDQHFDQQVVFDAQIGNGNSDAFVIKYSIDGNKEWTRLIGSAEYDYGKSITVGSDRSIYVAGSSQGNLDGQTGNGDDDAFVTRYSIDGTKEWTRLIGSAETDYAESITIGSDGSIYVAGSSSGNLDGQTGNGTYDAFVIKFDGMGVSGRVLTGTSRNDKLEGTSGPDLITGRGGADLLTGGADKDVFRYKTLKESRLGSLDEITDFAIGTDSIDAPRAVSELKVRQLGRVKGLNQQDISEVLTKRTFKKKRAATFTYKFDESIRTFVALNDKRAGFNAARDAIIEITAYSGDLANLAII